VKVPKNKFHYLLLLKYNNYEVVKVCFSNNSIEQQAFDMSERIRNNSIYKFVGVDFIGGKSLELQNQSMHRNDNNVQTGEQLDLITKVILEDKDGILYSVEPNSNGLRFAKGEITYKEYNKIQKKETVQGLSYFFLAIGTIFLMSWAMIRYLI
jgi:hypothetical protein